MTPFENYWDLKRGYRFGVKTFYTKHHLGIDLIVKRGTPIYAPCDGFVKNEWGKEGGYQAHLITDTHYFRFLHLSKYGKKGQVGEGDIIGYTGNTGLTTGPHCHHDIYNLEKGEFNLDRFQNFIDPDIFYLDHLGQKKI